MWNFQAPEALGSCSHSLQKVIWNSALQSLNHSLTNNNIKKRLGILGWFCLNCIIGSSPPEHPSLMREVTKLRAEEESESKGKGHSQNL